MLKMLKLNDSIRSDQISRSVVSNSLQPHESQHTRPNCPSPNTGVHSDSRPSSQWCHPAISSSVVPFSSCPQSFPASESFSMNQHVQWGGESTGVSASASVLPMNTQDWSPLGWTSLISLQSKGLSRVFSNTQSLFHFHQEALQFFFTFCHKGGVICISEVIDVSPGNLDSSLCFIQHSISHDVLCI